MREIEDVPTLRETILAARCQGKSIGLVPTMGYLHAGHLRLMEVARRENDVVVASIFVNPTQFAPHEDFDFYPRDLDRDRYLAGRARVDLLFCPSEHTMYPDGPTNQQIWVEPGPLGKYLDGLSRPGHFTGVATVVTKLFVMSTPDRAYFGQKDAQQAIIVRRLAGDLGFPIEVRIVETVRESDGLALSSRNANLTEEQRGQAPALWRALGSAWSLFSTDQPDVRQIEETMRQVLREEAPSGEVDYAAVVDLETLQPMEGKIRHDALLAIAVRFGSTRLIDNVIIRVNRDEAPS